MVPEYKIGVMALITWGTALPSDKLKDIVMITLKTSSDSMSNQDWQFLEAIFS